MNSTLSYHALNLQGEGFLFFLMEKFTRGCFWGIVAAAVIDLKKIIDVYVHCIHLYV